MNSAIAFIFPGQGSQKVGMLAEMANLEPIVLDTFAEASDVLGQDLWHITQENPDDLLNQTQYTQPALLAASVALWRVWSSRDGFRPVVLAGHSLGEYSALVCAEAMSFSDAINLVHQRGQFMQEAVPAGVGAMAAIIGLTPEKVAEACELAEQGDVVAPANFNAHGQIVISGAAAAVNRAVIVAKELGAKLAKTLPVSVPSHCMLMEPAATSLQKVLATVDIRSPKIPVLQNYDVSSSDNPDLIRDKLVKQLYSPVRWVETIEAIHKQGVNNVYESGPGNVLTGLNKRIIKEISSFTINTPESLSHALESLA